MFRNKFFDFITRYFDAFESLFIILLSVSLLLLVNVIHYSQYYVYASLGLLALLYWLMAMRPFEKKVAGIRIVIRRVVYVAYLLSSLSILASLKFDYEVKPVPMITASLVFLAVSAVLLLVKKYKMKESQKTGAHLVRSSVFAVILVWLLLMF